MAAMGRKPHCSAAKSVGHGPCYLQIRYLVHGSWLKWCPEEGFDALPRTLVRVRSLQ